AVGQPHRTRCDQMFQQALGHYDQWFVSKTAAYVRPFMAGLTADALIYYAQKSGQTGTVLSTLQTGLDWMWNNLWVAQAQAFQYTNIDTTTLPAGSPGCNTGGTTPAPDLNLLIAPAYAWVYSQTGDPKYLSQADQIFAGGVLGAYLGGGKQFDQNYKWS